MTVTENPNGTFDIVDANGNVVASNFASAEDAEAWIAANT